MPVCKPRCLFPNAVPVVDSFHVVQWLLRHIDNYIRQLIRDYRQKDRNREAAKSLEAGHPVTLPVSDEVYLLQKYRWLILSNQNSIQYRLELRMDRHLHHMMNTYDYETELSRISPRLRILRDAKEKYIQFNSRNAGHPMQASKELDPLVDYYQKCNDILFKQFAILLSRYREPIINSFVVVEKHGIGGLYDSRLSNGPIESLNRKVKDLKRLGRGFRNFDHLRNRFLYATRNSPSLSNPHYGNANIPDMKTGD